MAELVAKAKMLIRRPAMQVFNAFVASLVKDKAELIHGVRDA